MEFVKEGFDVNTTDIKVLEFNDTHTVHSNDRIIR